MSYVFSFPIHVFHNQALFFSKKKDILVLMVVFISILAKHNELF